LVGFWLLQPGFVVTRVPYLGLLFYLWFGVFNLLAVVQFWSFAADFYSDEGGRRLFPAIAVGATAGSATGAWLAQALIRSGLSSTYSLLLVAAAALIGSLTLLTFAEAHGAEAPAPAPAEPGSVDRRGAFRLVLGDRYLLAVAIVILVANWVKTNSDNLLFAIVQEVLGGEAASRGIANTAALDRFTADQTTAFYGDFFFWVNAVALVMQSFLASRLLKYGGFGALFLALPVISLVAYPMLAAFPLLLLFRLAKIESGSTGTLMAVGRLAVAGVERDVVFALRTERRDDTLLVSGRLPLLMTDYGITPPKALLGMLKTDPKITVTFETVLAIPQT